MAKILSLVDIQTGQAIEAQQVAQSIIAFTGVEAYDVTLSGSFVMQGPLTGTPGTINQLTASYAITASHALNVTSPTLQDVTNAGSITTVTITGSNISASGFISASSFNATPLIINKLTASYAITSSYALNSGTSPFPFSGSAVITGSLVVSSSNQEQSLQLYGSGSTIFSIEGSRGTLFSVDDDESDGTLFSVNNVSGTPILEVQEDNTVKLGKQNGFGIVISGSNPLPSDNDAKILITGSIHNVGSTAYFDTNITASGNISSSGYISASSFNATPLTINELTASYAVTASHALNVATPTLQEVTDAGSITTTPITASIISSSANIIAQSFTGSLSGSALEAISSSYALTASYVENAQTASYIDASNIKQPFTNLTASNLLITGTASINLLYTTYESSSIIYSSGSTKFGDTFDDFHTFTGSISSTGSYVDFTGATGVSGSFSGSFAGDGSELTNIPASGITGLNLSRIASGSVTASIAPNKGFEVNTNITASANISASGNIFANKIGLGTSTPDFTIEAALPTSDVYFNGKDIGKGINYATSQNWEVKPSPSSATVFSASGYFGLDNPGTAGSSIYGDFIISGSDGRDNSINWGTSHTGERTLIWKVIGQNNTSLGEGGWNKNINSVNNSSSYISIVYVKANNLNTNGNFYHGAKTSDTGENYTLNLDGTLEPNPIFNNGTGAGNLLQDVWCVSIGYIQANNDPNTTPNPNGGIYRLDTLSKIFGTNKTFKMGSGSLPIQSQRVYYYDSGNNGDSMSFVNPGFYEIDGSEPSLDEILNRSNFSNTASYVTTAQTASFVTGSNVYGPHGSNSVISSSHAVTASFALTTIDPFPYTGSADITGSLGLVGPAIITGSLLVSGSGNSKLIVDNNVDYDTFINGRLYLGSNGGATPKIYLGSTNAFTTLARGAGTSVILSQWTFNNSLTGINSPGSFLKIYGSGSSFERGLDITQSNAAKGLGVSGSVEIIGPITASGNISASGYISASSFNATPVIINQLTASYAITASHALNVATPTLQEVTDAGSITTTPITASIISASGNIIANNVFVPSGGKISFDDSLDGTDQFIKGQDDYIIIDGDNTVDIRADTNIKLQSSLIDNMSGGSEFNFKGSLYLTSSISKPAFIDVKGPITASNISSSGYISASSFNSPSSVVNELTASYAITASYALGADGFPFSGSAVITGSLLVSSSFVDFSNTPLTASIISASSYISASEFIGNTGSFTKLSVTGSSDFHNTDIKNVRYIFLKGLTSRPYGDTSLLLETTSMVANIDDTQVMSLIAGRSSFTGDVVVTGSLTASLNISASGNIFANKIGLGTNTPDFTIEAAATSSDVYFNGKDIGKGINYATSQNWEVKDGEDGVQFSASGYFALDNPGTAGGSAYGDFMGRDQQTTGSENIEWGIDPFGQRSLIWRNTSIDLSPSQTKGGFGKNIYSLNKNESYMSVIYLKRTSGSGTDGATPGGAFFHGARTTNVGDPDYTLGLNDVVVGNPYFRGSYAISNLPYDVWCVSVGIIQANNDSNTTTSPLGGIYRLDTGEKLTSNTTYKMGNLDAPLQTHRAFLYGSTTAEQILDFSNPGFYAIDGFEPSLDKLLNRANTANTASFVTGSNVYGPHGSNSVISSSHSQTSSFALTTVDPFPYTGSAIITGSLSVEGPTEITGALFISASKEQIPDGILMRIGDDGVGPKLEFSQSYDGGSGVADSSVFKIRGNENGNYGFDIGVEGTSPIAYIRSVQNIFKIEGLSLLENYTFNGGTQSPKFKTRSTTFNWQLYNGGFKFTNLTSNGNDDLFHIDHLGNIKMGMYYSGSDTTFITDGDILMGSGDIDHNYKLDISGSTRLREGQHQITGSAIISSSNSITPLILQSSGSTVFEVQGSQGQLFSVTDDLIHDVLLVNDISGNELFKVSGSGLVEVFEGSITTPQGTINSLTASHAMNIQPENNFMPVATHTSNFTSTSSYAGYYNVVGGNLAITVTTGSSPTDLTPGMEWNFFQTASAGNFTFTAGTGVSILSRNMHTKLAAIGSAGTLKYISNQEFHLIGDLTL
jgi:hypothetical protein